MSSNSSRIILRDQHGVRTLALVSGSTALTFKPAPASNPNASSSSLSGAVTPRCIVELLDANTAKFDGFKTISYSVYGTLGLITVSNDVFLCVVSAAQKAASVRVGETVQMIRAVDFYCLTRSDFDDLLQTDIGLHNYDTTDDDGYDSATAHGRDPQEHPCLALKKLLSGGSFYYSTDFDLTRRIQDRAENTEHFGFDSFDQSYLWNSYMIKPLIDFRSRLAEHERTALDSTGLLTSAIRGFAQSIHVPAPYSPARTGRTGIPSTMTLISRLSCKRAGTRFNARGVDDDGNVANFVETETIFATPDGICFSYVQVRGSIPIFWEQAAGLQQKINITRSAQAAQPAFDKHFEDLTAKYGSVHVVNLLSKEKSTEIELSGRYRRHIEYSSINERQATDRSADHALIRSTEYDFHAETRAPDGYAAASLIRSRIQDSAESYGYCLTEVIEEPTTQSGSDKHEANHIRRSVVVLQQQGVFRTNCLDCLDRTNLIQGVISKIAIESFLEHRHERINADMEARHNTLWADNGDMLSKIYAGTGALKSSFTRSGKMSLAGAMADARKSLTRLYVNNVTDPRRQQVIDTLLGRLVNQNPVYLFDPINDYVTSELAKRSAEYSSTSEVTIWAGTLNLNGRTEGLNDDLSPWLCPKSLRFQTATGTDHFPHIVAVGFQEIVELSPGQIMSTNPQRRQMWEKVVKKTLNDRAAEGGIDEKYVLLRGGQLVGASLSIFVRVSMLRHIKNVEGALQKTGMSGMAGNKGAVAIRMDISATSLCFVTAHLAAGFANYDERNRDYRTISEQLHFQQGRRIANHSNVIWLGDFNYRIGLDAPHVKELIKAGSLDKLYDNDQLNLQMVAGYTFQHFSESRISFPPTYKYDVGTDTYDTSEKSRIPAWCDRILRKGNGLRQIAYDAVPSLRFSDHRPVYAAFVCKVSVIDEKARADLATALYNQRKGFADEHPSLLGDDSDEEDLIPGMNGLPPPSGEKKRWWLDNGESSCDSWSSDTWALIPGGREVTDEEEAPDADAADTAFELVAAGAGQR